MSDDQGSLRASVALLKAVAENTSVGLVIVDRQHRYKFANDVYLKILGRSESVVGMTPAECLPPTYDNQTAMRLERAFSGERVAFETAMQSPDGPPGKMKYYSAVYEPEYGEDGEIIGAVVVVIDVTEQKEREEHVRLLMKEVNHRAKNLLGVVGAIARQISSKSPADFLDRFTARLRALAVNQDLLVKGGWKNVDITELVRGQTEHLIDVTDKRIAIEGGSVMLSAQAAEAIGMVIHELSTNAVKHGSLSGESGTVLVAWDITQPPDGDRFMIRWVERDGPPVRRPARTGFGTTVLTQLVEMSLDGKSIIEYAASGLCWSFTCKASSVLLGCKAQ